METGRHLALAGVAAGFFPRTCIADDVARGRLVEVAIRDLPAIDRDTALVRLQREAPLSPAAAAFVTALRAEAAALHLVAASAARRATAAPRGRAKR
jgi:DNA-binding transcriptional LysR family regulator